MLRLVRRALPAVLGAWLVAACAGAAPSGSTPSGGVPSGGSTVAALPSASSIGSPIADRAGVPTELHDRVWFTSSGEVGQLGTTRVQRLPDRETALAAGNGKLASAVLADRGAAGGLTQILVRRVSDWTTIWQGTTSVWITHAAFAGETLLWTGAVYGLAADGGLWAKHLGEAGDPVAVIAAASSGSGPNPVERGPLLVSGSGNTVASGVGSITSSTAQVIDVASLTLRSTLPNRALDATTDEVGFATEAAQAGTRDLVSLNLKTGAVGKRSDLGSPGTLEAILATDDVTYVEFQRGDRDVLAAVPSSGGALRDIASWAIDGGGQATHLAGALSSPLHLVLLSDLDLGSAMEVAANHRASVDVVDTTTLATTPAAFAVGAP